MVCIRLLGIALLMGAVQATQAGEETKCFKNPSVSWCTQFKHNAVLTVTKVHKTNQYCVLAQQPSRLPGSPVHNMPVEGNPALLYYKMRCMHVGHSFLQKIQPSATTMKEMASGSAFTPFIFLPQ